MPRAQAGVAAAIASTSRQVGASLGVAVVGAISLGRLERSRGSRPGPGESRGWAVMLGCGLGVLAMAWLTTTTWALRTRDLLGGETA